MIRTLIKTNYMHDNAIRDLVNRLRIALNNRELFVCVKDTQISRRVLDILTVYEYIKCFKPHSNYANILIVSLLYTYERKSNVIVQKRAIKYIFYGVPEGIPSMIANWENIDVYSGVSFAILNTSQGIMTSTSAKYARLGGTILVRIS